MAPAWIIHRGWNRLERFIKLTIESGIPAFHEDRRLPVITTATDGRDAASVRIIARLVKDDSS
jgi:hypothetical protein